MTQSAQIAQQVFAAFQTNDHDAVRALLSSDFVGRQNGQGAMDLNALLGFLNAVHSVVPDFRYEGAVRSATETGFVEEHQVRGTLPDGSSFDLAVCVLGTVKNGRVTELREYVNAVDAAGLMKALSG